MSNRITINLKWTARLLITAILTVTALSGLVSVINYFVRHSNPSPETLQHWDRIFNMFFLGSEINLPTWYATITLLACAIVLAVIAQTVDPSTPYKRQWWGLAIIFVALSIDENVSFHEFLGKISDNWLQMGGVFYYSWTLLGAAFVLMVAIGYWSFLLSLPVKIRQLIIGAGIIYVVGVIGIEMIEGYYVYLYTEGHLAYEVMIYIEEIFEMSGIALFLYALLAYLQSILRERSLAIVIE